MKKEPFLCTLQVTISFEEHCITVSYSNYLTKVSHSIYCTSTVDYYPVYCSFVKQNLESIVNSLLSKMN